MAWSNHWLVSIFLLDKALYNARSEFLRVNPTPSDQELKAFLMPLLGVCELEGVNWARLRQEWHASMASPLECFTSDPLPESRFPLDHQGNPASWSIREDSEGARIVFYGACACGNDRYTLGVVKEIDGFADAKDAARWLGD
jgi:hypothetical protein